MATQDEARIVKTPEVLGGKPRIAGRRRCVAFVHRKVEEAGLDPHTVADRHDLDVADVYRVLAYYHDRPDEMRRLDERRERLVDEAKRRTTIGPPGTSNDESRD